MASFSLHDESMPIPTVEVSSEEDALRDMKELYSIMQAAERLEDALIRGDVDPSLYTDQCRLLLLAYQSTLNALVARKWIQDINVFIKDYNIELPKAYEVLVVRKAPTDIKTANEGPSPTLCMQTTTSLLTTKDVIAVNQLAADQIGPYLRGSCEMLNSHTWLPADHPCKNRLVPWLKLINGMAAHDSIDESQARQLSYDIQTCYDEFSAAVSSYGSSAKH